MVVTGFFVLCHMHAHTFESNENVFGYIFAYSKSIWILDADTFCPALFTSIMLHLCVSCAVICLY